MQLVQSDNTFGLKLFKAITKEEKDQNVFISPLSVSMALGMTLNGANGETKDAMELTLELAGMTTEEINQSYQSLIELLTQLDPRVVFDIANSIWYRQEMTFKETFINLNRTFFDAVVQAVDFNNTAAATDLMNSWVDDKTSGRIKKIIGPDDFDLEPVMFLINAIYFKGTWTYKFDKDKTRDDLFTMPDGAQKEIKMMRQKNKLGYFDNDLFQAADLPYGNERFSMTVLLPHQHIHIDSLIVELNALNWNQWVNAFTKHEFTIELPKFSMEYEIKLNEILKTLGMAIAFDMGRADFSHMYEGPQRLFIDKVKHKTFVKVDEEGTEAAAVTSVGNVPTSEELMRVDRPFVFMIRENQSQTILFIGKIVEPYFE